MFNHNHDCPFEVYLTNLGKYNEGELIGEWVKFPTTQEELNRVLERIGIGLEDEFGQVYEEWFITDYDCYVDGIYHTLGEYSNLEELNYLATRLSELNEHELNVFNAACDSGEYTNSIKDLINITYNLDIYDLYEDINNDYDLGYYYIEEAGIYDLSSMGNLSNYIDYERFGRDARLEEGGEFTGKGYVFNGNDSFIETYSGKIEDIPEEYKLKKSNQEEIAFAYVYDTNGKHNGKIAIIADYDNYASFIMKYQMNACVITDILDQFIVSSTIGGFLDRCESPLVRDKMIKAILPYQTFQKEIDEVRYPTNYSLDLSTKELANQLTEYALEDNHYDFMDNESYPGETYDRILQDLKKGNINPYLKHLKGSVIENKNSEMVEKAKNLILDLVEYSNNYIHKENTHKHFIKHK